ncbi:MAG TPA: hypothetical protein VFZ28_11585 [Burkholderiaceae bacterium]|nr:hypothetical protein [Burkholderiaceae bacterium]
MEIERIAATRAVDQTMAAWAAAVDALNADPATSGKPADAARETLVAGNSPAAESAIPATLLPGADTDAGHEASTVQTNWRAPTPPAETQRPQEPLALAVAAADAEAAVPLSLLVPATLTGLRVDPAMIWPLPTPGAPPWQQPASRVERDKEPPHRPPEDVAEPASEPDEPASQPQAHAAPEDVLDAEQANAWCDALTAALRAALAKRIVARSLLCAAEQWRRGRCVVLACPQGDDLATGWAFVLWPRATTTDQPLALRGLRVDARLQWRTLPPATPWCHVRVVKEHHPRHGRQLVPSEGAPRDAALPCDVQLGPVLARSQRWCEVRVHIAAAQRFWAALGKQWSAYVVVSATPLLPNPRSST